MDLIDKKLLCAMDLDCRCSRSQIAKSLRISRNVADYRVKRLEQSGVIKKYICSISLGNLGYKTYKLDIETHALNQDTERKMIAFFLTHPIVIHCLRTEGIYSFSLSIATKTLRDLDAFLTEFKETFYQYIHDYHISMVIYSKIFKLNKILLDEYQKVPKFHKYSSEENLITVDDKDKLIITALSQQANLSLMEISKKTKLSLDIAKYRLKKIKDNLKPSFRIMLDFQKLGYYHYVMLLKLRKVSAKEEERLVNYCLFTKNILYCTKRIGAYDFAINLAIKNLEELNATTYEIKKSFGTIIDSYTLILNTELLKLNYIPF